MFCLFKKIQIALFNGCLKVSPGFLVYAHLHTCLRPCMLICLLVHSADFYFKEMNSYCSPKLISLVLHLAISIPSRIPAAQNSTVWKHRT